MFCPLFLSLSLYNPALLQPLNVWVRLDPPNRSEAMASNRTSEGSAKERLRWTQQLHDLFVEAVNKLGGPDRATPKSIVKEMKAMGVSGITIYHVKSHLQKYRISKLIPESTTRSKLERRSISDILPNFNTLTALQLKEALQLQMEVQKRLSDQLEVQRSLKLKMEAQGKYLERLGRSYQNTTISSKSGKPLTAASSLSCLSEESDDQSYNAKDKGSNVVTHKKQRVKEDISVIFPTTSELIASSSSSSSPTDQEFCNQSWDLFSWNQLAASCQSPLAPSLLL